jgi:CheY-like chemotaxis protein
MVQEILATLAAFMNFVASGVRDAFLEATFTAFLTALFVIVGAAITGRKLTSVDVVGVNLKFAEKETATAYSNRGQKPPSRSRIQKEIEPLVGNWKVLWIDDHPDWNRHEMNALAAVGFSFKTARSNDEAQQLLAQEFFQLIISDIGRDDGESGLDIISSARQLGGDIPIIFYVGKATAPTAGKGIPVVDTPTALFEAIRKALK